MTKQIEAFESWWADTGEQSLFALNTTTDDDIKILASIAWEAAIREALADHVAASGKVIAEQEKQEQVAWDLAEKVRRDLDRQSCPGVYMNIAVESIVKNYATAIRGMK